MRETRRQLPERHHLLILKGARVEVPRAVQHGVDRVRSEDRAAVNQLGKMIFCKG